MRKDNIFYGKLITGLLCIFLGVLFMINSSMLMRISFTVAGALLVACGIYLIINKRVAEGCIALTAGAVIIVFGWTLLNVLFIVVGVGLIIVSVCALVKKAGKNDRRLGEIRHNSRSRSFARSGIYRRGLDFYIDRRRNRALRNIGSCRIDKKINGKSDLTRIYERNPIFLLSLKAVLYGANTFCLLTKRIKKDIIIT